MYLILSTLSFLFLLCSCEKARVDPKDGTDTAKASLPPSIDSMIAAGQRMKESEIQPEVRWLTFGPKVSEEFLVNHPTVISFSAPDAVIDSLLENSEEFNEYWADFVYYWSISDDTLYASGIDVEYTKADTIIIHYSDGRRYSFDRNDSERFAGVILADGKKSPLPIYGVVGGYIGAFTKYFWAK